MLSRPPYSSLPPHTCITHSISQKFTAWDDEATPIDNAAAAWGDYVGGKSFDATAVATKEFDEDDNVGNDMDGVSILHHTKTSNI